MSKKEVKLNEQECVNNSKPTNKWQELVDNCKMRLKNGENPKNIFSYCGDFSEGFTCVELDSKYNFINTDGKFLLEQWFDRCYDFHNGFAIINLNDKFNYINLGGKLISEQWFDFCESFTKGFADVKLNGKFYKIDKNGKLC